MDIVPCPYRKLPRNFPFLPITPTAGEDPTISQGARENGIKKALTFSGKMRHYDRAIGAGAAHTAAWSFRHVQSLKHNMVTEKICRSVPILFNAILGTTTFVALGAFVGGCENPAAQADKTVNQQVETDLAFLVTQLKHKLNGPQ